MRPVFALVLLGALVAGCGANDPLAAEEVSAAAEQTADAGSSRIELTGEDGEDTFSMVGSADYEAGKARFTFHMTDELEPDAGELLLVGDTFYFRSDREAAELAEDAPGKTWISITVTEDERSENLDGLVFPFPFIDPSLLLKSFEAVSGKVVGLGEQDVRGVPTEGYRLTLDLARLIDQAPAEYRESLRSELAMRSEKTMPVEVWIDDVDRARRVVIHSDENGDLTVDFFDFGVEVDVATPPKDEVADSSIFLEGEESGSSGTVTIEEDE